VICYSSSPIANSTSKALGSITNGFAVCNCAYLTSLTPCTFNISENLFLHLAIILWESAIKSPSSFYYQSSRLVPFLEVIIAPTQIADIVYFFVCSKFHKFSLQMCLPFVPEISASITPYLLKLSTLLCLGSCIHCILVCLL
jgi:hypothetical protein